MKTNMNSRLPSSRNHKTKRFSARDKLELLRINIDETQKYELLTTNQYLKQIDLVAEILDDLLQENEAKRR